MRLKNFIFYISVWAVNAGGRQQQKAKEQNSAFSLIYPEEKIEMCIQ